MASSRQPSEEGKNPQAFPVTRWTLVLTAQDGTEVSAHKALSELCEMYWFPLYGFARHSGCGPEDAQDATQAFLADLLSRDFPDGLHPDAGRLRSYLRVAMKHFLLKQWRTEKAIKRGGGRLQISIDFEFEEGERRYQCEPTDNLTPDLLYERQWALTLLKKVLDELEAEYRSRGKGDHFEALRGSISLVEQKVSFRKAAERLRLSEGAARVAAYRLRQRYEHLLMEEISHTVTSPTEIREEIDYLLGLFTHR